MTADDIIPITINAAICIAALMYLGAILFKSE